MDLNRYQQNRMQIMSEMEELLNAVPLDTLEEELQGMKVNDELIKELLYFLVEVKTKLATSVIYRVNGMIEPISPKNGKHFQLEELQELVGGYIEIKVLPNMDKKMILNEEGKLMELPINRLATEIYRDAYYSSDIIVGDVLICDNKLIR